MKILFIATLTGIAAWLLTISILLPLTDATDGQGHGPDPGSAEWKSTIERKTDHNQQKALQIGITCSLLAIGIEKLLKLKEKS